jgi:hypothetical protein
MSLSRGDSRRRPLRGFRLLEGADGGRGINLIGERLGAFGSESMSLGGGNSRCRPFCDLGTLGASMRRLNRLRWDCLGNS